MEIIMRLFALAFFFMTSPALASTLTFNACGTGWDYTAKGENPTVEWFSTDLQGGGSALFIRLSQSVTNASLSGQAGNFNLDLPIGSLSGLQNTILQHHYYYVSLSYHADSSGSSSSQVLENLVVSDTNGQPKPPCL